MSNTELRSSKLGVLAEKAKAEVERLREEINAGPGRLAEVERRLNSATSQDTARMLIEQRARLRDDREVNLAALKGAEIYALRSEAAYVRALAEEAAPELPDAVAADEEAKANLAAATEKAKLASKRRGRVENSVGELTSRANKLSLQADALEGLKPQMV